MLYLFILLLGNTESRYSRRLSTNYVTEFEQQM